MIEEGNQRRDEALNVDSCLANLSRKCSNCGQTGHNSRTCLEIREPAASEAEHKSSIGDSVITHAPAQQTEQADKTMREDDAEISDCSSNVSREIKKKGMLPFNFSSLSKVLLKVQWHSPANVLLTL